ncbi:MAG: hypothetical protein JNM93_00125 [Bacteriovoracaceae bacterium]|nr:hypothetical protein [Bacteriovoracaceae bacterium]
MRKDFSLNGKLITIDYNFTLDKIKILIDNLSVNEFRNPAELKKFKLIQGDSALSFNISRNYLTHEFYLDMFINGVLSKDSDNHLTTLIKSAKAYFLVSILINLVLGVVGIFDLPLTSSMVGMVGFVYYAFLSTSFSLFIQLVELHPSCYFLVSGIFILLKMLVDKFPVKVLTFFCILLIVDSGFVMVSYKLMGEASILILIIRILIYNKILVRTSKILMSAS